MLSFKLLTPPSTSRTQNMCLPCSFSCHPKQNSLLHLPSISRNSLTVPLDNNGFVSLCCELQGEKLLPCQTQWLLVSLHLALSEAFQRLIALFKRLPLLAFWAAIFSLLSIHFPASLSIFPVTCAISSQPLSVGTTPHSSYCFSSLFMLIPLLTIHLQARGSVHVCERPIFYLHLHSSLRPRLLHLATHLDKK